MTMPANENRAPLAQHPRPCPFCMSGAEALEVAVLRDASAYVLCLSCEAEGPSRPSAAEAVEAWNRPARLLSAPQEGEPPAPDALRERVRSLYVEAVQSGVEHAADVAGEHCKDAGQRVYAARHRIAAEAGRFLDESWGDPDWPTLAALTRAVPTREE